MDNIKTAIALENEIMKASDLTFGYDSAMDNIAVAMKSILSGSDSNYVIGGVVMPYSSGGMNVSIAPIFAYCENTEVCVAEIEKKEPISFEEADDVQNRIDLIQISGKVVEFDLQYRKFIDPGTGTESTRTVNTKKKIALDVVVKTGSKGSASAPTVDEGYIKLAEVNIPAGTSNITQEMIKNITARKSGVENQGWTADKTVVFNPGYLADVFYTFLIGHQEDGKHKDRSITADNIKIGTGAEELNGENIPLGLSMSLRGDDYSSLTPITNVIIALAENIKKSYEYSNNILSRYEFCSDIPVAASTTNIDISTGGEMNIDGVTCTIGQLVFLKDQTNAIENGFYEVQAGEWNRYVGYTEAGSFINKYILIPVGTENKGKIFYLSGDTYTIGVSELNFVKASITPYAKPHTAMIRDKFGRAKVSTPVEDDDIAIKSYVDGSSRIIRLPVKDISSSNQTTNLSEFWSTGSTPLLDGAKVRVSWVAGDASSYHTIVVPSGVTLCNDFINYPPGDGQASFAWCGYGKGGLTLEKDEANNRWVVLTEGCFDYINEYRGGSTYRRWHYTNRTVKGFRHTYIVHTEDLLGTQGSVLFNPPISIHNVTITVTNQCGIDRITISHIEDDGSRADYDITYHPGEASHYEDIMFEGSWRS